MKLETFFNQEDIKEIYDYLTLYSILNYNKLPREWQERFKRKYRNTLKNFQERQLDIKALKYYNQSYLKDKLNNYLNIYKANIKLNESIIKEKSIAIEQTIIETIQDKDELTKISFLFDFITNYIDYATNCYNYCLRIPVIDNFLFDFKNNIPVDTSISGLLVMHQGICDDISNLMIYLGDKLNLKIDKVICKYKNQLHSLNYITLEDSKNYLIDATRMIRKQKTKKECFLVSDKILNKNKDYQFEKNLILTNNYLGYIPDYHQEALLLVDRINEIIPESKDINYKRNKIITRK